ncbi:methionyl-tRNA formyltransferase [uncultured Fenollaria sp.]|uniref:methionyl-tRNA formyltransferase n=1 Tax=uncultured Fenollaria sp. TaxID=1686315 RepID=UPI0025FC02D1|nr:methionyl-tRNA formyltransferase [uncultured Fenollaria sp.]
MKVIYMGTPLFSLAPLKALKDHGFDIAMLITQPDRRRGRKMQITYSELKTYALENDIEVFQPEDVNSSESIEKIKNTEADVIVVASYGQIIKEEILYMKKYHSINIHASLLPKYRGAAPVQAAIINEDEVTGITLMKMAKGLDTGNILMSREIAIADDDTADTLTMKLSNLGAEMIVEYLSELTALDEGSPQDDAKSSYVKMIKKEDAFIDFNESASKIEHTIRAMQPWPVAFTTYKGENMKIFKAAIVKDNSDKKAGTILNVNEDGILVKCKDEAIIISEVQMPNKKRMKVSDYIRGNKIEIGERLGDR